MRTLPLQVTLGLLLASSAAVAQSGRTDTTKRAGLIGDLLEQVAQAESKILSLARAFPDSAYQWRPAVGVRSTHEVFVHIAGENYYAAAKWGGRIANESGVTAVGHLEVEEYERRPHARGEALAALEQAFALIRASLAALPDSGLDVMTEYSRRPVSVRTAWVRTTTHLHEHLGQLIAYARANGVVPPWSR
jgi:uncharacterized damage-inducible protein DinB